MQHTSERVLSSVMPTREIENISASPSNAYDQYRVIRRNGSVVPFNPSKIVIAMTKAFLAVGGGQGVDDRLRRGPGQRRGQAEAHVVARFRPRGQVEERDPREAVGQDQGRMTQLLLT